MVLPPAGAISTSAAISLRATVGARHIALDDSSFPLRRLQTKAYISRDVHLCCVGAAPLCLHSWKRYWQKQTGPLTLWRALRNSLVQVFWSCCAGIDNDLDPNGWSPPDHTADLLQSYSRTCNAAINAAAAVAFSPTSVLVALPRQVTPDLIHACALLIPFHPPTILSIHRSPRRSAAIVDHRSLDQPCTTPTTIFSSTLGKVTARVLGPICAQPFDV